MIVAPITQKDAKAYIAEHHRHHKPPVGSVFQVSVRDSSGHILGVAMAGRPVARGFDDGQTLEVNRVCTDGTPNACSMLYGACRRAAKALGWSSLITYTLASEGGASLRGAGWERVRCVKGRSWDTPSRPRTDDHPTTDKVLWKANL